MSVKFIWGFNSIITKDYVGGLASMYNIGTYICT
jgi:hypothetical protein